MTLWSEVLMTSLVDCRRWWSNKETSSSGFRPCKNCSHTINKLRTGILKQNLMPFFVNCSKD
jgi:hypothetical protein